MEEWELPLKAQIPSQSPNHRNSRLWSNKSWGKAHISNHIFTEIGLITKIKEMKQWIAWDLHNMQTSTPHLEALKKHKTLLPIYTPKPCSIITHCKEKITREIGGIYTPTNKGTAQLNWMTAAKESHFPWRQMRCTRCMHKTPKSLHSVGKTTLAGFGEVQSCRILDST